MCLLAYYAPSLSYKLNMCTTKFLTRETFCPGSRPWARVSVTSVSRWSNSNSCWSLGRGPKCQPRPSITLFVPRMSFPHYLLCLMPACLWLISLLFSHLHGVLASFPFGLFWLAKIIACVLPFFNSPFFSGQLLGNLTRGPPPQPPGHGMCVFVQAPICTGSWLLSRTSESCLG